MKLSSVVLALLTLPFLCSFRCGVYFEVGGSLLGVTVKLKYVGRDAEGKCIVEETVPPGAPAGQDVVVVGGREIQVKWDANPTDQPKTVKITVTDPLIVQVPIEWNLLGFSYSTPYGSGQGSVQAGPIPYLAGWTASGAVVATQFYQPEAGYKLYLMDIPDDHKGGETALDVDLVCPTGSAVTAATVKVINAFTAESQGLKWYLPMSIGASPDFANHNSPDSQVWIDFSLNSCVGPNGHRPHFESSTDWRINTTASMLVDDMDPSLPASFMVGSTTLLTPGVPFGGLGCQAFITPDAVVPISPTQSGQATFSFTIPNNPSYVGLQLFWQGAQLTQNSDMLLTPPLLARIDP